MFSESPSSLRLDLCLLRSGLTSEPVPEADGDGEDDQEGESENNAGPAEAAEADPPPSAGRPKRASKVPAKAGAASPAKKQKKNK